jgi:hypothetical protein
MCDLGNLVNEEAIARVGLHRHMKKKNLSLILESTQAPSFFSNTFKRKEKSPK